MDASFPQPKKKIDASLLNNEILRPWTHDPKLEGRLKQEMDALERTIQYTAPQMKAGKLGSSVLDGKIPEIEQFSETIKVKASRNKELITKLDPMNDFYPLYVTKSNIHHRLSMQPASNSNSGMKSGNNNNNNGNNHHVNFMDNTTSATLSTNPNGIADVRSSSILHTRYGGSLESDDEEGGGGEQQQGQGKKKKTLTKYQQKLLQQQQQQQQQLNNNGNKKSIQRFLQQSSLFTSSRFPTTQQPTDPSSSAASPFSSSPSPFLPTATTAASIFEESVAGHHSFYGYHPNNQSKIIVESVRYTDKPMPAVLSVSKSQYLRLREEILHSAGGTRNHSHRPCYLLPTTGPKKLSVSNRKLLLPLMNTSYSAPNLRNTNNNNNNHVSVMTSSIVLAHNEGLMQQHHQLPVRETRAVVVHHDRPRSISPPRLKAYFLNKAQQQQQRSTGGGRGGAA